LGGSLVAGKLDNRLSSTTIDVLPPSRIDGLQRIAEVPIYHTDAVVRRAPSLQKTRDAEPALAWMHPDLYARLALREGDMVRVRQDDGEALVAPAVDDRLPADCIRLAAGRAETAGLGAMFGSISVERIAAQQKRAV
jgi:NADH-quinone oxidoreductase subunit G